MNDLVSLRFVGERIRMNPWGAIRIKLWGAWSRRRVFGGAENAPDITAVALLLEWNVF